MHFVLFNVVRHYSTTDNVLYKVTQRWPYFFGQKQTHWEGITVARSKKKRASTTTVPNTELTLKNLSLVTATETDFLTLPFLFPSLALVLFLFLSPALFPFVFPFLFHVPVPFLFVFLFPFPSVSLFPFFALFPFLFLYFSLCL